MTLFVKYDFNILCKALLKEHLDALGVTYTINSVNEISVNEALPIDKQKDLTNVFQKYGIEIVANQKINLVERIKSAVDDMLRDKSKNSLKLSSYLSETLNYSYTHLSTVFSDATYTSIENYAILRKVDLVKDYLCNTNLTLTEIAFQLNYSSVAHLSGQFKKMTGLTPSAFQRIMENKKNYNLKIS